MTIGLKKIIEDWIEDGKKKIEKYDEEYKRRLKEEGGLNVNVMEDCKDWITKKINLLFSSIMTKTKPG